MLLASVTMKYENNVVMLERSNVIPGSYPDQGEASQGGGCDLVLLDLPALRFFVVLLALSSEGLLQKDSKTYFRESQ